MWTDNLSAFSQTGMSKPMDKKAVDKLMGETNDMMMDE